MAVQNNGGFEDDVNSKIVGGWMKWRETSGILCNKMMPLRLKDRFYITVVRLVIFYRSKCYVVNYKTDQWMSVTYIRMLRWMFGVTREDIV